MTNNVEVKGRAMALDLGERRIGIAISDELQIIASSYGVIKRKSRQEDYLRIRQISEEQKVKLLIVGLPITLGGQEGEKAAWVRDYTAELSGHLNIPIEFWDESLTTVEAEESLRLRGIRGQKAKKRIDAVAAAFILQKYLDAHA
jgi:putative Holliday junction resolvase